MRGRGTAKIKDTLEITDSEINSCRKDHALMIVKVDDTFYPILQEQQSTLYYADINGVACSGTTEEAVVGRLKARYKSATVV